MPVTCVVGLQWGDEAKGKVVDILTERNEMVVRYQGGSNAGHTVVFDGESYKLSLVPSGIFRSQVKCIIAGGVVLNPASFIGELDGLILRGISVDNLMLSDRAHIVLPWHMEEDRFLNALCTGGEAIGTTMRGIGPCYRDKIGRSLAIRVGDMYRDDFEKKIAMIVKAKKKILIGLGAKEGEVTLDPKAIYEEYRSYAERLKPYVADTTAYLLNAVEADKKILFEGAQGALLDIDHGTFPFVTSSNSSGVGVSSGSGIPARYVTRVVGILKAYTTRVGGGPFPTEQDNEIGQHIREMGNEYGTVTKRPRRCGWFDAVAARYTTRLSGVDTLSIMLLDVLSELPELQICTAYEIDGVRTTDFPSHVDDLRKVVPIYETMPGWQKDITDAKLLDDLPQAARAYLDRLSELIDRPVGAVSIGPDREQTILCGI